MKVIPIFKVLSTPIIKKVRNTKRKITQHKRLLNCAELCKFSYEFDGTNYEVSYDGDYESPYITGFENDEDVKFLFLDIGNTEGFCMKKDNRIIVCFRGTNDTSDAIEDLKLSKVEFHSEGKYCGKVHRGFHAYYERVKDVVSFFLKENYDEKVEEVIFTGHSLGSCVAYAALDFGMKLETEGKDTDKIHYVSFGSPRLGNGRFVETFESVIENSTRVVNKNDPVTTVPVMFGYTHIDDVKLLGSEHEHGLGSLLLKMITDPVKKVFDWSMAYSNPKQQINKYIDNHMINNYIDGVKEDLTDLQKKIKN